MKSTNRCLNYDYFYLFNQLKIKNIHNDLKKFNYLIIYNIFKILNNNYLTAITKTMFFLIEFLFLWSLIIYV